MTTTGRKPVGLVLGSAIPPEQIRDLARVGEDCGMNELWLAEDYFFTGGIAGAAAALEVTSEIAVGTGVASAMVRHPALLAMETSTLGRMHPGRFLPGIGLGVPHWVQQMHLYPKSQLRALRECTSSVRRLLAGETLTERGEYFGFDEVTLTYPLDPVPPIYLGVLGPKMLNLSGEIADGTATSVFTNVEYLGWMRERIAEGQAKAGRTDHHRVVAFAMFCCDEDSEAARDALRPIFSMYLSMMPKTPMTDAYGISDRLVELAEGGPEAVASGLESAWMADLAVVGNPEECAAQIQRLLDAGADSVALFPQPTERCAEMARLAGEQVLPLLGATVSA
jgi:alkanesulfonate monooxygenase SsuD/methylene tetrahydromethanopterin reductase-like flavin-dependent oxidoreductase (luciferase family)